MPRIAPFRIDVVAAGQLGMKAVPTSSSDPTRPRKLGDPVGRLGDSREDLEQRALAGAVAADHAEHLAVSYLNRHVPQGPDQLLIGT